MRGRKPIPPEMKAIQGGDQAGPQLRGTGPIGDPPENLSGDERDVWSSVVSTLPDGVLFNADRPTLECLCISTARLRAAEAHIREHGMIVESGGRLFRNPATTISKEERVMVAKCASELGLSPVARLRLTQPVLGTDDFGAWEQGGAPVISGAHDAEHDENGG